MKITFTFIALIILYSCSEAAVESNNSPEETISQESPEITQKIEEQPMVLENDNYPEDWKKMKVALISKVENDIGVWCAIVGVNKEKLVQALNKPYVMEQLKVTELSDLVPDQKGKITYLKFYAQNPNDASQNLSIFIKQGEHLILEYFIELN